MGSIERFSDLDESTAKSIGYHAKRLENKYGFSKTDVEDIEQELWLYYHLHKDQYDPKRASRPTFVNRILTNCIRDMIRKQTSQARDYTRASISLDRPVRADDGGTCELSDTLTESKWLFGITPFSSSGMDASDLKIDLWRAFSSLKPEQQILCRELLRGNYTEAARSLGWSRQKVHRLLVQIREVFKAHGLDQYYMVCN